MKSILGLYKEREEEEEHSGTNIKGVGVFLYDVNLCYSVLIEHEI